MNVQEIMNRFTLRYGPEAGERGPELFVEEVLGVTPDPWQREVLREFGRGGRRISIASCHGPGKTATAAWMILYMLLFRFPQKTVATAPTSSQLQDALVPEVLSWFYELPEGIQGLYEVKSNRIELRSRPEKSYFSVRTSRAEKPEAMAGVHEKHVLLIADEASGVPEAVYEHAVGSMSDQNATTLLISNPVRTSGFFYDTHHKLSDMWFTMRVSHEDSERVTDDFVEDVRRRYGENSNAFRVRCLGLFPKADDDTIIPFELVESAKQREITRVPGLQSVWGLDVARFGSDRCVLIQRSKLGIEPKIHVWSGLDTMETAGRVKGIWDDTLPNERPDTILVDVIGMGAGVVDRLKQLGLPVRGINVAESAAISERFYNARAELWWKMREWLAGRDTYLPSDPDDHEAPAEQLARELVVPKYMYTPGGKIKLEPKKEMKQRIGYSPDFGDAAALTFAVDLALVTHGSAGSGSWNEPIKRGVPIV